MGSYRPAEAELRDHFLTAKALMRPLSLSGCYLKQFHREKRSRLLQAPFNAYTIPLIKRILYVWQAWICTLCVLPRYCLVEGQMGP